MKRNNILLLVVLAVLPLLAGCAAFQPAVEVAKQAQQGAIDAQRDLAKARAAGICRMPADTAAELFPSISEYLAFAKVCKAQGINVLPEGVLGVDTGVAP